ncbi:MAG TPA: hypothetical protein PK806_01225 [Saprospiraceae bacterium]|nr:hypothetical protein [Saprospiraceae bacterium]
MKECLIFSKKTETAASAETTLTEHDELVECAQCHLRIPRHEAITDKEQFYCSDKHREQHQAAQQSNE